jgi:hypothetical protein
MLLKRAVPVAVLMQEQGKATRLRSKLLQLRTKRMQLPGALEALMGMRKRPNFIMTPPMRMKLQVRRMPEKQ